MSVVFPVPDTARWRRHAATAGQTVFAIPYPFQAASDISVTKIAADGTETLLSQPADYSVAGAGEEEGGSYTLTQPAAAGEAYLSVGDAVLQRLVSIVRKGRFSSAAIDEDLDRAMIIAQELRRDVDRSLKLGVGAEALPEGHFPIADANGNMIDGGDGGDIAAAAEAATAAVDAADRAAAAADDAEELLANVVEKAETDASGFGFVVDEDDMASDSDEKVPTQRSVRTYADTKVPMLATKAAAQSYAPVAAPDFLRTGGYLAVGDAGGALYKQVPTEPSHNGKFSISLSDGVTVVWYEIAEPVLSVRMFGADPTGEASSVAAFSDTIQAAQGRINVNPVYTEAITTSDETGGGYASAIMPEHCHVIIPDGIYKIDASINRHGKFVNWHLGDAAIIVAADGTKDILPLGGKIKFSGRTNNIGPSAALDQANAVSGYIGDVDDSAGVWGFHDWHQIGSYSDTDMVAGFRGAWAPAIYATATVAEYTSTGATFSSAIDPNGLVIGMCVETATGSHRAQLVGWAADGTSIDVPGWVPITPGSVTAPETPSGTPDLLINPFSKVWGDNVNVILPSTGHAARAALYEGAIFNNKADATSALDDAHDVRGIDIAMGGDKKSTRTFVARGNAFLGYGAYDVDIAFSSGGDPSYDNPAVAFESVGAAYIGRHYDAGGNFEYVRQAGHTYMGNAAAPRDQVNDFTSSGLAPNYDVRVTYTGGSATDGTGTMKIEGYFAIPGIVNAADDAAAASAGVPIGGFYRNGSVVQVRTI